MRAGVQTLTTQPRSLDSDGISDREYDLNTGNNTVTATTKVMTTGGGGGRGKP